MCHSCAFASGWYLLALFLWSEAKGQKPEEARSRRPESKGQRIGKQPKARGQSPVARGKRSQARAPPCCYARNRRGGRSLNSQMEEARSQRPSMNTNNTRTNHKYDVGYFEGSHPLAKACLKGFPSFFWSFCCGTPMLCWRRFQGPQSFLWSVCLKGVLSFLTVFLEEVPSFVNYFFKQHRGLWECAFGVFKWKPPRPQDPRTKQTPGKRGKRTGWKNNNKNQLTRPQGSKTKRGITT